MKKDLKEFIGLGANLKFGPGAWSYAKKSLIKTNNDLIIITSKSCKNKNGTIPL